MTEEDTEKLMMRACLAQCARRLRHYENKHRMKLNDYLTMIERQQTELEAAHDNALCEAAEAFLRKPTGIAPTPLPESTRPARVSAQPNTAPQPESTHDRPEAASRPDSEAMLFDGYAGSGRDGSGGVDDGDGRPRE